LLFYGSKNRYGLGFFYWRLLWFFGRGGSRSSYTSTSIFLLKADEKNLPIFLLFGNKMILTPPAIIVLAVVGLSLLAWAITTTVLYSQKSNEVAAGGDDAGGDSGGGGDCGGGGVVPAGSVNIVSCMSLNILTAGKDGFLDPENKWDARKSKIQDFITTSNFDFIALQEVSDQLPVAQSQTQWFHDNFDATYDIFGESRGGVSPESTPIMVKKSAGLSIESKGTVLYTSGKPSGDYQRTFTWAKLNVDATNVKLLFISTQMHRNDSWIPEQKADIQELSTFIKANNDGGSRQVIVVGDWNITVGVYSPYEDLATITDLTFYLGLQSGSTGTRPKQVPKTDLNVTQYMSGASNDDLDVGSAYDVFVYSKSPLLVANNAPNRYMRATANSSGTLYGLSDHDPVAATFVV
jgi:endonuclease/exonuclease/phosphatase family metal-dependent hydrolase